MALTVFWLCPQSDRYIGMEDQGFFWKGRKECHTYTDAVFLRYRSWSTSWPTISPLCVTSHEEAKECGSSTPSPLEEAVVDNGPLASVL